MSPQNPHHIVPFNSIDIDHCPSPIYEKNQYIRIKDSMVHTMVCIDHIYDNDTHILRMMHEQDICNARNIADVQAFFERICYNPQYTLEIRHQYSEEIEDYLSIRIQSSTPNNIHIKRHTYINPAPVAYCMIPATYDYPSHITPTTSFADIFAHAAKAYKKHYAWIPPHINATKHQINKEQYISSLPAIRITFHHSRDIYGQRHSIMLDHYGTILSRHNINTSTQDIHAYRSIITDLIAETITEYPNKIMQPHNTDSQHQQIQEYKNIRDILPTLIPNLVQEFNHIHQLYAQHYRSPIPATPIK